LLCTSWTTAFSRTADKLQPLERGAARAQLVRDVAAVHANLPVVTNPATYDAEIISVGLSVRYHPRKCSGAAGVQGDVRVRHHAAVRRPRHLFSAALNTELGSNWYSRGAN
jgi:hypothetical protein